MIDVLTRPEFWLLSVSLIAVIWIKQRMIHKDAYRIGATQGFVLGVDRTIKVLDDLHMINKLDHDGNQMSRDDIIIKMTPLITASVIQEMAKLIDKSRR